MRAANLRYIFELLGLHLFAHIQRSRSMMYVVSTRRSYCETIAAICVGLHTATPGQMSFRQAPKSGIETS